jgi:hypothetical protein
MIGVKWVTFDVVDRHYRVDMAYVDVQSTMVGFLMVQQAVMPTNVLPAPHGNTMIPDRARLYRQKRRKVRAVCGR